VAHVPDVKIEDERFAELISQANSFQRLLYVPYAVFACAAMGILYGMLFSLPLIWIPFMRQGMVVIVMICIIFSASVVSATFVYAKHGISIAFLYVIYFIAIFFASIYVLNIQRLRVDGNELFVLVAVFSFPILIPFGELVAMLVLFQIASKSMEIVTKTIAQLSKVHLKEPFGKNYQEYRGIIRTLLEYFNGLKKVVTKYAYRNPFKRWLAKLYGILAGCLVILYLPIIGFLAVFDLIGQLNLVIQRWGVYQILRITSTEKIKKGASS
jgi:hypothetical protein